MKALVRDQYADARCQRLPVICHTPSRSVWQILHWSVAPPHLIYPRRYIPVFKTWTQPACGLVRQLHPLLLVFGFAYCSLTAQELTPPDASDFEKSPVFVPRLPAVISQPPAPVDGVEVFRSGSGETFERLPPAIENLPIPSRDQDSIIRAPGGTADPRSESSFGSSNAPASPDPGRLPAPIRFRAPELHLMDTPVTTFDGDMSGALPPAFMVPMQAGPSPPESVDEFLPQMYHPPFDVQAGTVPRAYVPPPILQYSEVAQWTPWWDEPLGRVSLLNSPTIRVNLQELMNLSLRNSPVVHAAREAMQCGDCGRSKARVDAMLYAVAQGYWETYRLRGVVVVRERLYQDALDICRQLKVIVGNDDDLTVLAVSSARERLANLAAAHQALRKSQNKLASVVSIPNWEQELEMLPMDSPYCRPYRIDEAAELHNALSRRSELQGLMRSIQATSYRHPVGHRDMSHSKSRPLRRYRSSNSVAPIQVHSFVSPELEEISDKIKLEVKNAIVRIVGSYETMRRFSHAAQASAQEVATLQARCDACSGSTNDLPLLIRDLLDAQSRLANIEQRFVSAQANYSAAILELRRANGTIIDRCTFHRGGPIQGPGISNPRTVNAVWNSGQLDDATEAIFQSPQENLEDHVPNNVELRESEWQGSDRKPSQIPMDLHSVPSADRRKLFGASPEDYNTPRGEFPMPSGEQLQRSYDRPSIELLPPATNELIPSERQDKVPNPNRDANPVLNDASSTVVPPYDFESFGRESSLSPPSQSILQRSPEDGVRRPLNDDLGQSLTPAQLWQLDGVASRPRVSSHRPFRR